MSLPRDTPLVVGTDRRIELRRVAGLASMVFHAAAVALVLALALGADRRTAAAVGPGVLWVASLLAGTVGLGRLLERERRYGGWSALLLSPVSRTALFLGKSTTLLVLILVTDAVLVPLVALLFRLPEIYDHLAELALLLVAGAAGYALVATLLGAIALQARTGELLLGAVLYPLVIPILVGGVKGTVVLLGDGSLADLRPWLGLVLLGDALFLVAGLWLFESLTSE